MKATRLAPRRCSVTGSRAHPSAGRPLLLRRRMRTDAKIAPVRDISIRLGVSACLLGHPVRYDGGHKRDRFLTRELGPHVEWVAVCPEVELGLGTPRDPIRLVGAPEAPRLVVEKTSEDLTARMQHYARDRVREL